MISTSPLLQVAISATDIGVNLMRTVPAGLQTAKGDRDMATEADFAIERAVRKFLADATPEIDFLGEEDGRSGAKGEWTWALDPIDGTVNFLHGLPLCAISLALLHNGHPVVGVIDLPWLGTRYTAVEGEGAHENGRPIRVAQTSELHDAIVALGDYSVSADAPEKNKIRLAITAQLAARAQRVRMFGSAAIDLAWLASGRIDASITMSNNQWDMAAGIIIAREAGALVLDAEGAVHSDTSTATIALVPQLQSAILPIVASALAA